MDNEPSLVERGSAIMDYRKKMQAIFTDHEGALKAKADFDEKLKKGRERATKRLLKTIKDDGE